MRMVSLGARMYKEIRGMSIPNNFTEAYITKN